MPTLASGYRALAATKQVLHCIPPSATLLARSQLLPLSRPAAAPAYLWEAAGLVQQVQNAHARLNQVQHILVVHELDVAPLDRLTLILRLLHLENVLIEMLLKLLVRQVDAELLKIVFLELLEACRGRISCPNVVNKAEEVKEGLGTSQLSGKRGTAAPQPLQPHTRPPIPHHSHRRPQHAP